MSKVEDFLNFRKLITTPLIKIIYLIVALFITLLALSEIAQGSFMLIVGFFMLIVGNILWRVFCEVIIVQFRIHDELVSINSKITSMGGEMLKPPPPPPLPPEPPSSPEG
jgi:hypothetical protein